jgi:phosphopentomutase
VLKLAQVSNGKDTMTGHWEIMGIKTTIPFKTFTDTGFPKELLDAITLATGRKIIGNTAASGTQIIEELGPRQMKTGELIVYTSADSVLQIAAHEQIIPLEELYHICQTTRDITLADEWRVGRIIARPYLGNPQDGFKRTTNRHDYALSPTEDTVLNYLNASLYDVISVGKIRDIFNNSGITAHHGIHSNHDGMLKTMALAKGDFTGLAFVNLVDFDALYGHRRDPLGYRLALEEFDTDLGMLADLMGPEDLLMVSADHGNDPTHHGTDHTREYVPLFIYGAELRGGRLPDGDTFADIGATIADNFHVTMPTIGHSLLSQIR